MASRKQDLSSTIERSDTDEGQLDSITLPPGEQFLTKGILLRNRRRIVALAVMLLAAASILSYFVKPHENLDALVRPEQELPGYAAEYPGNSTLSKRVTDSYSLAWQMIGGPYTAANVQALENVRSWAQNQFETSPNFLHPISVKNEQEPNDTVVGALGYNLFANIRYGMESTVGTFLRSRIADYHNDPAYDSFSNAYFKTYGRDAESATLLARYQSDKAKGAIDVILWTLVWSLAFIACGSFVAFSPRRQRFEHIRLALSLVWILAAVGYACTAWMSNSIPAFMSAVICAASAFYFAKPFMLLTRQDSSLKVYFIQLSSRWLALSVWASYSVMAITILTWIRCTLPDSMDPVTLVLSALSGNFLTDPEDGKRIVARVLGTVWLVLSLWAFFQKDMDAKINDELDAELRSL